MRNLRPFIALFVTSLILAGCSSGPAFEQTTTLANNNWNRFHTLWYDFEPRNHDDPFTISLIVRHTPDVPFDVLQIMGTIHTPSGEMRYREYSIPMKGEDRLGTGELNEMQGSSEMILEKRIVLRDDFVFQEEGKYRFEIENLMSKYDNPGIVSVAVVVE